MRVTRTHRRRNVASVLVAFLGLVALMIAGVSTFAGAETDHCPDHNGNEGKVEAPGGTVTVDGHEITVVIDGNTVTFTEDGEPIDVTFCMKASTKTEGPLTGSSGEFTTLNPGGQVPDISYVVVYSVPSTTTTTSPTTTTTEVGATEETTTTTAEVAGVVVEPEPPEAAPEQLAFTGVGVGTAVLAAVGLGMISLGIGLSLTGRRRVAWVRHDR